MMLTATENKILEQGLPTSTQAEMDFALEALYANRARWVQTDISTRIKILNELLDSVRRVIPRMVEYSQSTKRVSMDEPGGAEDWALAAVMVRQLREYKHTLEDIQAHGHPQIPGEMTVREDGRVVAPVFPRKLKDRFLLNGLSAEIWFRPEVSQEDILARMGAREHDGRVALVLGAGNVMALLPGDFLYKLFVENQVVILKMNPVNEYLGPLIEEGYAPLVELGYLRVVYGGVEQAQYLIHHEMVDELHMTGSDRTYEAIMFGTGDEAKQRKQARDPKVNKRFTAELGNITPIIVVPGPWSPDEIQFQGRNIASQLTLNAGFNCLTPRVIVQHQGWGQRDALNQAIAEALARVPTRYAYYPNAHTRHRMFLDEHSEVQKFGLSTTEKLPWTYIPDVDPSDQEDIVFNTEAFCSLMAETALQAQSVPDFIEQAVEFVNKRLWGTLTATIIVHPQSMKNPAVAAAIEQAIADLRYGTICVNTSGGFAYGITASAWGGHSGQDMTDIQSGTGFVNNALLFDDAHIQKSVVRGQFDSPLNRQDLNDVRFNDIAKALVAFESEPGLGTGLGILRAYVGL